MRLLLFFVLLALFGTAFAQPDAAQRGEYLARVGNCAGCHTAPGGPPYAGGRVVQSEFGTFYAPNLTPDSETGIGAWSAADFRRSMREGRLPDGSALYPACPYPNFTRILDQDLDALYAYLRRLPAVSHVTPAHQLAFPYSVRALARAWQWLYFKPAPFQPSPQRSDTWNRGAYLVEGLGHCSACHAARGRLGAVNTEPSAPGGLIRQWYAPSLYSSAEAGLQQMSVAEGARLLREGKAGDASMLGPMAVVVAQSLQYLSEADALAMAEYLHSLPDVDVAHRRPRSWSERRRETAEALGAEVYGEHCADCHGDKGEGSIAAPALAGNRAVAAADPSNLHNIVRLGGYPPSTEGNPRPYGMPPFAQLGERELGAVVDYIRLEWGGADR